MALKKRFDYTIFPDNNNKVFREACNSIERAFSGLNKRELLIDVDGSTIQEYGTNQNGVIVYDDYDVGAVYVKSDFELATVFPKEVRHENYPE